MTSRIAFSRYHKHRTCFFTETKKGTVFSPEIYAVIFPPILLCPSPPPLAHEHWRSKRSSRRIRGAGGAGGAGGAEGAGGARGAGGAGGVGAGAG